MGVDSKLESLTKTLVPGPSASADECTVCIRQKRDELPDAWTTSRGLEPSLHESIQLCRQPTGSRAMPLQRLTVPFDVPAHLRNGVPHLKDGARERPNVALVVGTLLGERAFPHDFRGHVCIRTSTAEVALASRHLNSESKIAEHEAIGGRRHVTITQQEVIGLDVEVHYAEAIEI